MSKGSNQQKWWILWNEEYWGHGEDIGKYMKDGMHSGNISIYLLSVKKTGGEEEIIIPQQKKELQCIEEVTRNGLM